MFEKQELIKDSEDVFDGTDRFEVSQARSMVLKWMINEMYKRKRLK